MILFAMMSNEELAEAVQRLEQRLAGVDREPSAVGLALAEQWRASLAEARAEQMRRAVAETPGGHSS